MSSQFDMNQQPRICAICVEVHPIHNPCKYDRLVQIIHSQKQQILSLLKGNREIVQTAKDFQKIIVGIEPELCRLYEVEKKYELFRKISSEYVDGPLMAAKFDEEVEKLNGAKNIQAETRQLSFEEVQPSAENTEHVRPNLGVVPTAVPENKP